MILIVMLMLVITEASQRFCGTREHANLFSENKGILTNTLREQWNQIKFGGTGNMDILKVTFREQGRLFLGNKGT